MPVATNVDPSPNKQHWVWHAFHCVSGLAWMLTFGFIHCPPVELTKNTCPIWKMSLLWFILPWRYMLCVTRLAWQWPTARTIELKNWEIHCWEVPTMRYHKRDPSNCWMVVSNIFMFIPIRGRCPFWLIFSDGLQPPTGLSQKAFGCSKLGFCRKLNILLMVPTSQTTTWDV